MNIYHPLPFEKFDRIIDTSGLRSSLGMRIGEANSFIRKIKPSSPVIANGYQRIYFYHVRKTGGTSIAYAFYRIAGDPYGIEEQLKYFRFAARSGYTYVGLNPRLIRKGDYFFASSHIPKYETSPPERGTFEFTVLRDPMERVISLYRYLSNPGVDRLYASEAFDHEHAWAAGGFGSFLRCVPQNHLLNQLYMFSRTGNVDEAVNALQGMSCVLRTETLTEDILDLERRLGISIQIGVERKSDHIMDLASNEMDLLREMTEPEYEMIGRLKS